VIVAPQHRRPLNEQQEAVLRFVVRRVEEVGAQPSITEIAAALGTSVTAVHRLIRTLQIGGWVEHSGGARSLILAPDVRRSFSVAGTISEAVQMAAESAAPAGAAEQEG
jgi:DNA-binding IclR family transcriptional regulator